MQEFLDKFLEYGYLILFIYSLGGGMLALAALGVFAAGEPRIDPVLACATAMVANFLGSLGLFWLCKSNKKEFSQQLNKHRRKIALMVIYFRKSGFMLTLLCKFLYGFKTIAPLAAELAKLSYFKYIIYNLISCVIWSILVFFIARAASSFILELAGKFNNLYLIVGFLILLALCWLLISRIIRRKNA